MGVYIKGMEMPKNCYVCPFCDYVSARCDAVNGNPYTPESRYEKRADFCPLVPVPPHGRLGDLDALKVKAIERSEKCGVCVNVLDNVITAYDIETAPTIIPADPTEEGET